MPDHIRIEFEKLSPSQKEKFNQLLAWSGASGLPGIGLPMAAYEKCLEMARQMGEEPSTPVEPDRTINHDWDFIPTQKGRG